jgi:hypothetical protein
MNHGERDHGAWVIARSSWGPRNDTAGLAPSRMPLPFSTLTINREQKKTRCLLSMREVYTRGRKRRERQSALGGIACCSRFSVKGLDKIRLRRLARDSTRRGGVSDPKVLLPGLKWNSQHAAVLTSARRYNSETS